MEKKGDVKRKLYAQDFESLGVIHTNNLVVRIKKSKIILEHDQVKLKEEKLQEYKALLAQNHQAKVCLQRINEKIGYGVFAEEDIELDDMIGEYTGELISSKKAQKLMDQDPCGADFFMHTGALHTLEKNNQPTNLYVDAKKYGNFTRFINHSANPNIDNFSILGHDKLCHIIVVACRPIKRGEQLLIDYGPGYWCYKGIAPEDLE